MTITETRATTVTIALPAPAIAPADPRGEWGPILATTPTA
jgi:hypothetical protein